MKQHFLTGALVMGAVAIGSVGAIDAAEAATLGGYNFGTGGGTLSPTTVLPGVKFSDFSYTGDGTDNFPDGIGSGSGKAYSSDGFSEDTPIIFDGTGDPDGFFSFTVTPDAGNTLTFSGIQFATKRNGDASPQNLLIRSSLDNFAMNLFTPVSLGVKNRWTSFDESFNPLLSATSAVTFRIYPFLRTGNRGVQNLDIDDVFLKGSVTSETVPTPALLPGLVGLGVAALRKKKQAAEVTQDA